jgi:TetR/AcrR family transcriptional regulator
MARPRASDHESKRSDILERAAALFAEYGYDRTSLVMLAQACGMSKALLYHYYTDKSELLFDIIRTHLEHLLAVTEAVERQSSPDPRDHLLRLAEAVLDAYRTADNRHHIQIGQMHLLPPAQQDTLKQMERTLAGRFAAAIAPCVPQSARGKAMLKPLTMSLFGMLNWHYLWFREDGPMSRSEYARLAVTLLVEGAASVGTMPAPLKLMA